MSTNPFITIGRIQQVLADCQRMLDENDEILAVAA